MLMNVRAIIVKKEILQKTTEIFSLFSFVLPVFERGVPQKNLPYPREGMTNYSQMDYGI